MHCTVKKTVHQIIASENHYCIGLKGNQGKLLAQAQQVAQSQPPVSVYQEQDSSHGRQVSRRVQVFAAPVELQQHWSQLSAFVSIERQGCRDGKVFATQSWAILSAVIPAQRAAGLIRQHRGSLENRVHWVKDVVQGEDSSLIRASQPAQLMALLRSWVISLFRHAGYDSITKAMRLCKHDLSKLISLL